MPKFKVIAQSIITYELIVEAEDVEAAWQLGKEADGGEFTEQDYEGGWSIYDVNPLSD